MLFPVFLPGKFARKAAEKKFRCRRIRQREAKAALRAGKEVAGEAERDSELKFRFRAIKETCAKFHVFLAAQRRDEKRESPNYQGWKKF